ncbi:MAG: efflux RND transporter permease subunit [Deltaproteobacteria bacterium]|nr:efflux RND transporter permease subunit [Deltaproteobacteria bacterium]
MSDSPSPWEQLLPRFSIGRPTTVLVLCATALVVGIIAAVGIPLETFPQGFTPSFLSVVVPWQDAPSQEVLDKIVIPLEDELSTVAGLAGVNSLSDSGRGMVFLNFKQGTDMDVAYREVRDRVQRARSQLPEDADKVFIRKNDLAGLPVFMIGLAVDPELTDAYSLIQNEVIKPLERVQGIASVDAFGLEEKEILIEVDRQQAEASGLNIYQLAQELQADNFTLASGNVRSGSSKLLLRSVARYDDRKALENRLVAPSVRLSDIAEIEYEEAEKDYSSRVNGKPAIALPMYKEGQANTLEVCRRVKGVIAKMENNPRLQGLSIVPIFNQGDIILSSLGTMFNSGRVGAFFAILVLFFFLRRFRMTLIITLSIPLSLLIALTAMYFAGETLNILTLLGLMISVGLLVDNSVVVAENIHRMHREGASRKQACIRGAGEISMAIVMATLTTVAVFLPVSLVDGDARFFLLRLSMPISISLLGSLLVALIFVPLAAYITLPSRQPGASPKKVLGAGFKANLDKTLRRSYDLTLGRVNRFYGGLLAASLGRRLDLILILLAIFGITIKVAFGGIELAGQQDNERTGFEIDASLPASYTLEDAKKYFLAVEEVLETRKDELDLADYFISHDRTDGEVQGWLKSPRNNDLSPRQISDELMAAMPEAPGVKLFTGEESRVSDCDEDGLYCLRLYADDAGTLAEVRSELETLFRTVDGVTGVKKSGELNPNELALQVDREKAQRQGINPEAIAGVVSYALRGQSLPKFYRDGKEIPVRVRFKEENRDSLAELSDFQVPNQMGGGVALSSITEANFLPAQTSIFRRDRRVSSTIALELADGKEKETRGRVRKLADQVDLPEGVRFGVATTRTDADDVQTLVFAGLMSVIFVYLLMTFLFESFILPLSIIFTIPLASIGVGWIHFLSGYNLDFLGGVACVLLIGVVVNNGIVLIDYVNRLREEGTSRTEALLTASNRRFRPIMMTALTTICATVPLALGGATEFGLSYTSFGLTLIGGMTTATLLTLLVVPIFYTLFDDARQATASALHRPDSPSRWRRKGFRRWRASPDQTEEEAASPLVEPAG